MSGPTSNPSGFITVTAAADFDIATRVALDVDFKAIIPNAEVKGIGTAVTAAANGSPLTVQLYNQGKHEIILEGNAPNGDAVAYAADNGEVTATQGNVALGTFVSPTQIVGV